MGQNNYFNKHLKKTSNDYLEKTVDDLTSVVKKVITMIMYIPESVDKSLDYARSQILQIEKEINNYKEKLDNLEYKINNFIIIQKNIPTPSKIKFKLN